MRGFFLKKLAFASMFFFFGFHKILDLLFKKCQLAWPLNIKKYWNEIQIWYVPLKCRLKQRDDEYFTGTNKKEINILMIARSNTVVAKEKDGMLLW